MREQLEIREYRGIRLSYSMAKGICIASSVVYPKSSKTAWNDLIHQIWILKVNWRRKYIPCFNQSNGNAELSDVFLEELFTLGMVAKLELDRLEVITWELINSRLA